MVVNAVDPPEGGRRVDYKGRVVVLEGEKCYCMTSSIAAGKLVPDVARAVWVGRLAGLPLVTLHGLLEGCGVVAVE